MSSPHHPGDDFHQNFSDRNDNNVDNDNDNDDDDDDLDVQVGLEGIIPSPSSPQPLPQPPPPLSLSQQSSSSPSPYHYYQQHLHHHQHSLHSPTIALATTTTTTTKSQLPQHQQHMSMSSPHTTTHHSGNDIHQNFSDLNSVTSYASLDGLLDSQHHHHHDHHYDSDDGALSSIVSDDDYLSDDYHDDDHHNSNLRRRVNQQYTTTKTSNGGGGGGGGSRSSIEQRIWKDGLKDDDENDPSREYTPVNPSAQFSGFSRFLREFFTLGGRAEKYWKQHYFFILLTTYLVGVGLLWAIIIYLIERNNLKWRFIDCLYHSFSALCLSGFLVQPVENTMVGTQVILVCSMFSGGLWFTALFPLFVKIRRARRRMMNHRRKRLIELKSQMQSMSMDSQSANQSGNASSGNVSDDGGHYHSDASGGSGVSGGGGSGSGGGHYHHTTTDTTESGGAYLSEDELPSQPAPSQLQQQRQQQQTPTTPSPTSSTIQVLNNGNNSQTGGGGASGVDTETNDMDGASDAMTNYSNATHMEPSRFNQLPPSVQQYFSSAQFDVKKFNPAYWPEAVKTYFTQEASYEYIESIPYTDIEYTALVWLLVLTLLYVGTIHLVAWIALSISLTNVRDKLLDKNPWWISCFYIVSAFNNVGMAPFSDSVSRFVHNADVCLIIAFVILLGNTAFPILLRLMIFVCYKFSKRYKLVFKYMLEKHHHLSLHLFPGIQTRAYMFISIALLTLGVVTPLIMDHNNGAYEKQPFRIKLLIAFFHACSARTGGFQSIDFSVLSMASICVYLLMMRVKSQMACGLRENAYKIVDIVRQLKEEDGQTTSSSSILQADTSRQLAKSFNKRISSRKHIKDTDSQDTVSIIVDLKKVEARDVNISEKEVKSKLVRAKVFIQRIFKHFVYHTSRLFSRNNTWIALSIFIIAISESGKGINNPSMNLLRIVFEVISAFGNVGLSIGFPDTVLAFSSALNPFSKFMIVVVMLAGRHRGWYGSMTDQQEDEYDVNLTDRSLAKHMVRLDLKRRKKSMRNI